jgi:hypothetical protein
LERKVQRTKKGMKQFLLQNGILKEADFEKPFTVQIFAKEFGESPVETVKFDGTRFDISKYHFKKIQASITSIRVIQ